MGLSDQLLRGRELNKHKRSRKTSSFLIPSRASFSYDQAFILVPLETPPFDLAEVKPFMPQKNCFIPKCLESCACSGKNTLVKEKFHILMIYIRKGTKMHASRNVMPWKTLPMSISVRNTDIFATMKFLIDHLTIALSKKIGH